MKKSIFTLLLASLFFMHCSKKNTDVVTKSTEVAKEAVKDMSEAWRSQVPTPAPARPIEIGQAQTIQLDNGLTVIVVENHKLPRVSYQLSLKDKIVSEGSKAGYVSIAGDLMSRGTTNRTKAEIDEEVDFIGGSLSTFSSGIYASSLKKHSAKMLDVMTDVLYNPAFKKEEFEKLKTRVLSGLASSKANADAISNNVTAAVNYGKNHPYGEVTTESTIANISTADCKQYYDTYFRPNNAYLIVVGDITPQEAEMQAKKYFGSWKKGVVKKNTFTVPSAPQKRKVAIANKDGAVQSVIKVSYPIQLKPGSDDAIKASVMNSILGGGIFSGRLMQNLREDKAFTYGARSTMSTDELVGEFKAYASVRNMVTDSSVHEFLYEMERLRNEPVSAEDLAIVKNSMSGSFARSLESPQTIARFALNTIKYGLPADYYNTYLQRLDAVTIEDVQAMAKKYIRPENANIIIVGAADEISEKLKKYDADGKIDYYDSFGNKVERSVKLVKLGITGKEVVEKYLNAIGGEKLKTVKDMYMKSTMDAMGQKMETEIFKSAPNKYAMKMSMGGNVMQEQKYDGMKGYTGGMGGSEIITEGEAFEGMKEQAMMFPAMGYLKDGYKLDVKGTEKVNDEESYKLQVTKPDGKKQMVYIGKESNLIHKITMAREGQDGTMMEIVTEMAEYKEVDGIKLPQIIKIIGAAPFPLEMKVVETKINSGIPPATYMIK